jgi:DNA-directed RNA polymerase specialized sigma24 family protein
MSVFLMSGDRPDRVDDAALLACVRRAVAGDPAAVERVLSELRPTIVRTARLIVGAGSSAAEDAAQDALIDITGGLPSLRDPTLIRPWALKVATRRAIRVARRERLFASLRADVVSEAMEREPLADDIAALKAAFYRLPTGLRRDRGLTALRRALRV